MRFDPPTQCLARMVAFMDAHADCGLAGCRIEHADGGNAFAARRFQTLPIILARRFGLDRLAPNVVDRYLYRRRDPQATFDCDWLSGCFLLARREALGGRWPLRRTLRQVLRGRGHGSADAACRVAGDVSRRRELLPSGAARQRPTLFGRRLAASWRLSPAGSTSGDGVPGEACRPWRAKTLAFRRREPFSRPPDAVALPQSPFPSGRGSSPPPRAGEFGRGGSIAMSGRFV